MTHCDYSDLPAEMCAHCRGIPDEEPRGEADAWTEARYDNYPCPGCKHAINVGDRIGLVDGEWLCEGCAS